MSVIYHGVVRDGVIVLADEVQLAEGSLVEVRLSPSATDAVKRDLQQAGRLLEIKEPAAPPLDIDRTPIRVEGMPLSKDIIEARR